MSHVHARDPICPRMLATTLRRDSTWPTPAIRGIFRSFRTAHSSHTLREGARPEVVRIRRGKDCYAGVAFKQTWIEDKQCAFALWFLQLL